MPNKPQEPPLFVRNVPGMTGTLAAAVVGIAGCGGLGSNAAVALARAGIGKLILADFDLVEPSNLNRQHFFQADMGSPKVEALAAHLRAINPEIILECHQTRLQPELITTVFGEATLLIEAFDRAESKQWLIETWCGTFPDRPIVGASGLAGYGRTELLKVHRAGRITIVGDEESDMSEGLCAGRVMAVAAMQANIAIELIMNQAR